MRAYAHRGPSLAASRRSVDRRRPRSPGLQPGPARRRRRPCLFEVLGRSGGRSLRIPEPAQSAPGRYTPRSPEGSGLQRLRIHHNHRTRGGLCPRDRAPSDGGTRYPRRRTRRHLCRRPAPRSAGTRRTAHGASVLRRTARRPAGEFGTTIGRWVGGGAHRYERYTDHHDRTNGLVG